MRALITGRGAMGRGLRDALEARGDEVVAVLGRPHPDGNGHDPRPAPESLGSVDVSFEFSHASTLEANLEYALAAGCRSFVVGTTGWTGTREAVFGRIEAAGGAMVWAPTFSPGAVLFGQLAETAARLFGRVEGYDPYVFEWHRRTKPDRPSGTALAIAERVLPYLPSKRRARLAEGSGAPDPDTLEVVSLRAGASPGLHVFGFDAPGESLELRLAARDRSAYVAGALLAADWLLADRAARTGVWEFGSILNDALGSPANATRAEHTEDSRASLH